MSNREKRIEKAKRKAQAREEAAAAAAAAAAQDGGKLKQPKAQAASGAERGPEWQPPERVAYRPLATQSAVLHDLAPLPRAADTAAAARFLREWAAEPRDDVGLLDLRDTLEFDAGHVRGATCLPWGAERVFVARAHELPPRGARLAVMAQGRAVLDAAVLRLQRAGYPLLFAIQLPTTGADAAAGPTPPAGGVELAAAAAQAGCAWERGAAHLTSRQLWSASPLLTEAAPLIEAMIRTTQRGGGDAGADFGAALDLGCASGRDCVWLARRGWRTVGVDYLPKMLERFRALVDVNGVAQRCVPLQGDVEKWRAGGAGEAAPPPAADLVCMTRYLHREGFDLLRDELARPSLPCACPARPPCCFRLAAAALTSPTTRVRPARALPPPSRLALSARVAGAAGRLRGLPHLHAGL